MYIWTSLATLIAVAYYLAIGLKVASVRTKVGIAAPAMSGNDELERALRVQANAVEFAPIFFPSLWLAAIWAQDGIAAVFGLVWVIGRLMYALAYWQQANKRTLGFTVQVIAASCLWLMALAGVIRAAL